MFAASDYLGNRFPARNLATNKRLRVHVSTSTDL